MSPRANYPSKPLLYKVGLDVGESSLGWWIWEIVTDLKARPFMDGGVMIFDSAYSYPKGSRADTKNALRREKRSTRRLTRRRAHRRRKLRYLLKHAGLWPGDKHAEEQLIGGCKVKNSTSPYELRLKGLTEKLELFELGRALQHLAQRRGFKSNRKNQSKDNKEEAKQQKEQDKTNRSFPQDFADSGHKYLVQYLSELSGKGLNVRRNLILRKHIEDELTELWDTQTKFHPQLLKLCRETVVDYNAETEEKEVKTIKQAIFDTLLNQLKYDRFIANKIEKCSLEPGKNRAHRWHRKFREFELWQRIHNLRYRTHWDEIRGNDWKRISKDQADKVFEYLNLRNSVSQGKIKELLGFKGKDKQTIVLNFDKETTQMEGNPTESALSDAFEERWSTFNDEYRDSICRDVIRLDEDVLEKKAREVWFKDSIEDDVEKKLDKLYTSLNSKSGYGSYSLAAIQKLLPELRQGSNLHEATLEKYKDRTYPTYDFLPHPPGRKVRAQKAKDGTRLPTPPQYIYTGEAGETSISNPVVMRSLSAVRKLVNKLIKRHGKPQEIIVELARDVKLVGKKYDEYMKKLKKNKDLNDLINKEISRDHGSAMLSFDSKQRYRLHKQFDICPYCQKSIHADQILNTERARIDIEHIIPKSRCKGGDSIDNLILSHAECNRGDRSKKNMTPAEYFGTDSPEWKSFLAKIEPLQKSQPRKYEFLTTIDMPDLIGQDGFTNRQLNDTSYASRAIRQYLQCLYPQEERAKRVKTVKGHQTALFRKYWGLNQMLNGVPDQSVTEKNRNDLRHHALDALVISLADDKRLYDLEQFRTLHAKGVSFPTPWPSFHGDVESQMNQIVVYSKPARRLRGALAEDTMNSMQRNPPGKRNHVKVVRSDRKTVWSKPGANHHIVIMRDNKGKIHVKIVPLFTAIKQWNRSKKQHRKMLPQYIEIPGNMEYINHLCPGDLIQVQPPGSESIDPRVFSLAIISTTTSGGPYLTFEPCDYSGDKGSGINFPQYFSDHSNLGRFRITTDKVFPRLYKVEVNVLGEITKSENLVIQE